MLFDPAKLPDRQWLTLSEAVNYLAFRETHDAKNVACIVSPADRAFDAKLKQSFEQCRKDARAKGSRSNFLKKLLGVRDGAPFILPSTAQLPKRRKSLPQSCQRFCALIEKWDRAHAEDHYERTVAEREIRVWLSSGKVIFEGRREGRIEKIDADLFYEPMIFWGNQTVAAYPRDAGKPQAGQCRPMLVWEEVRIDVASLVRWLTGAAGEAEMAANEIHPEQEPNLSRTTHRTITRQAASRESARQAIPVVFPDGMPSTMRSQQRLNKINDYLMDNGLPKVSPSTFRRAQ